MYICSKLNLVMPNMLVHVDVGEKDEEQEIKSQPSNNDNVPTSTKESVEKPQQDDPKDTKYSLQKDIFFNVALGINCTLFFHP